MTKDQPPRFSILIPLHNKAGYIGATLASVLAQTFRDFEVVVVDDGSTDGGAAVVETVQDPRVRLVRQANAGVSLTRNRAINLARGEWVTFLDADDWQHPEYLACLADMQRAHPRAEAVATRFVEFEDDGTAPSPWPVSRQAPVIELITDLPARWMRGPSIFTGSLAVRRKRLRSMQPCFAPGESWGEDLDMFFRLAERTPIALAHVPLVGYRKGVNGSLTGGAFPRELPPWVDRLDARVRSGAVRPSLRASSLALIAQFEVDMARRALAESRRMHALRWLTRAAPQAVRSRRWWTTGAMALLPAPVIEASLERIRDRSRTTRPVPVAAPAAWQPARQADEAIERLMQPGQRATAE